MDGTIVLIFLILLAILVILSAFFALSETSYTSMNRIRMKNYAKEGNKKAEKALRISENYDRLITTILIGNNFVNMAAATISSMLFVNYLMEGSTETLAAAVSSIVITLVVLTFGEITPKCIAKERAERLAMSLAGTLSFLIVVFYPLSVLFVGLKKLLTRNSKDESDVPSITEEELIVMIDEIEGEGTIDKYESDLIKSAIEFDDITVGEMFTPRVDVTSMDIKTTKGKMKEMFRDTGFSRIPVYNGTIDRIVGVIYSKDFYNLYFESESTKINDIIRPVKFVPTTMKISSLLKELQKSKVHMAVVVDQYGGTLGIVTLEDIVEELIGEIWDESDEIVHAVTENPDGSHLVLGGANIYDMMEETGIKLDLGDYEGHTMGGFVLYKLGRIPLNGDSVDMDNVKLIVKAVKHRRIREVTIIKKDPPAEEEESE